MDFKNSKNLGCIGALIMAFGGIPIAFAGRFFFNSNIIINYTVVQIVGMILILISMYNLSKFYQAKNIFTNARIGVLGAIVTTILFNIATHNLFLTRVNIVAWLLSVAIFWVVYIIVAVFIRRSLTELAARSSTRLLAITGELLFFSVLLFLVIIGLILLLIFLTMLAIAFFIMKEPKPIPQLTTETTQPTAPAADTKDNFCSTCGTPVG